MRSSRTTAVSRRIETLLAILAALVLPSGTGAQDSQTAAVGKLFTRSGSDPTFESWIKKGGVSAAKASTAGVSGSRIHVNKQLVEAMAEARRPICQNIKLHTLFNSAIPRKDFLKWSRWYQEDGRTQVFRLFAGEENRHGDRELAARVEAFSTVQWTEAEKAWHEWSGVVTAINPVGLNFQLKNAENAWAVAISVSANGKVTLNHRRGKDEVLAENMIGKPFLLRVRDDGLNYEVFFNGVKAGTGSFQRPNGRTSFRWGMYVGDNEVKHDAMIFFSGVTVDGKPAR